MYIKFFFIFKCRFQYIIEKNYFCSVFEFLIYRIYIYDIQVFFLDIKCWIELRYRNSNRIGFELFFFLFNDMFFVKSRICFLKRKFSLLFIINKI